MKTLLNTLAYLGRCFIVWLYRRTRSHHVDPVVRLDRIHLALLYQRIRRLRNPPGATIDGIVLVLERRGWHREGDHMEISWTDVTPDQYTPAGALQMVGVETSVRISLECFYNLVNVWRVPVEFLHDRALRSATWDDREEEL